MIPVFSIPKITRKLGLNLERLRAISESLKAETFSLSLKPTTFMDGDDFFGGYLIGAFPIRYKNWLKDLLEKYFLDDEYRIVVDPSQEWLFVVSDNDDGYAWALRTDLSTSERARAVADMRSHGLAKSVSGQEGKAVYHLHMYAGGPLDRFSQGFIDSKELDRRLNTWGFPDFETMSKNPESMNIYHFFQCADKTSPPLLVDLWKKSRLKYHEKKADSSLQLIAYKKPYFVVKESWQPDKLIRSKTDNFRGLAQVKEIVFPGCKYRFSSSLPG